MKKTDLILQLIVVLIGLVMIGMYAGKSIPPVLSGLAFTIIGIANIMRK